MQDEELKNTKEAQDEELANTNDFRRTKELKEFYIDKGSMALIDYIIDLEKLILKGHNRIVNCGHGFMLEAGTVLDAHGQDRRTKDTH